MGEKVRLHWAVGITVHDFAYKAVDYTVFKVVSNTNCWNFFSVQKRLPCKYLPQASLWYKIQKLVYEKSVLDNRMGSLFSCVCLTIFLPLFKNHLEIPGVVFMTSVEIFLCAFSLPLQNHCYIKIQTGKAVTRYYSCMHV